MAKRKKESTRRRRATDPEAVEEDLRAKLRAAERATSPANFSTSRDALAALTIVRAIERALELADVEDGSVGLKRALRAASKPLGSYVVRHMESERRERRKKA